MSKRKKRVEWTASDIIYLKQNFPNTEIPIEKIMSDLNRSEGSIYKNAKKIGLKRELRNEWTEMEDEYLRNNYENKAIPFAEICEKLKPHKRASIIPRANQLGLNRTRCKVTQSDIDFILEKSNEWTNKDIAAHLGITKGTVSMYLIRNKVIRKVGRTWTWTNEEVEYIKSHYENKAIPMKVICEHLGKSSGAIRCKANLLGLSRSRSNK